MISCPKIVQFNLPELKIELNMTTNHEEKSPAVVMFKDLDADEEQEVTEIESLCMNCQENVGIKKSWDPDLL